MALLDIGDFLPFLIFGIIAIISAVASARKKAQSEALARNVGIPRLESELINARRNAHDRNHGRDPVVFSDEDEVFEYELPLAAPPLVSKAPPALGKRNKRKKIGRELSAKDIQDRDAYSYDSDREIGPSVASTTRAGIKAGAKQAFVYSEILGKPRSKRPHTPQNH